MTCSQSARTSSTWVASGFPKSDAPKTSIHCFDPLIATVKMIGQALAIQRLYLSCNLGFGAPIGTTRQSRLNPAGKCSLGERREECARSSSRVGNLISALATSSLTESDWLRRIFRAWKFRPCRAEDLPGRAARMPDRCPRVKRTRRDRRRLEWRLELSCPRERAARSLAPIR